MRARVFAGTALLVVAAAMAAALPGWMPGSGGRASATGSEVTIPVGDNWFCSDLYETEPCVTTISAGDTVTWDFGPAVDGHTTTECGPSCPPGMAYEPLWDSPIMSSGSFSYAFGSAGTYYYYCEVHPFQQGTIIVEAGSSKTGDVNCQGGVDAIDGLFVLQYTSGFLGSLPCQDNANVNGDVYIDSVDALYILQFAAGFIDEFPA